MNGVIAHEKEKSSIILLYTLLCMLFEFFLVLQSVVLPAEGGGGGVIQFDGGKDFLWRSVVLPGGLSLLLKLLGCDTSVACVGLSSIVHYSEWFPQHPPLCHLHQRLMLHSLNRASLPDELVESVGVGCLHPAAPAHYSMEEDAGHHRVIKHLQHGSADIERPEPPERKQDCLTCLLHCVCVSRPVRHVL